jgi:hypothetical protein
MMPPILDERRSLIAEIESAAGRIKLIVMITGRSAKSSIEHVISSKSDLTS